MQVCCTEICERGARSATSICKKKKIITLGGASVLCKIIASGPKLQIWIRNTESVPNLHSEVQKYIIEESFYEKGSADLSLYMERTKRNGRTVRVVRTYITLVYITTQNFSH